MEDDKPPDDTRDLIDVSTSDGDDGETEDPTADLPDKIVDALEKGKEAGTITEHESRDDAMNLSDDDGVEDGDEDGGGDGDGGRSPDSDAVQGSKERPKQTQSLVDSDLNGRTSDTNTTPSQSGRDSPQTQSEPKRGHPSDEQPKREQDTHNDSQPNRLSGVDESTPERSTTPPEAHGVDQSAVDMEGLADSDEEEEWTWGQEKDTYTFTYKGMEVTMSEPDDDDKVLSAVRNANSEDMSEMDQLRIYAQLAIDSPEITQDRWENHMTPTERLKIGNMASRYIEGEGFTNGSESGPNRQPGSSRR